jgi:hypothetical protein
MPTNKVNKVSIQLNSIEELFAPPQANPFEPDSRYVTGIDELVQQLNKMRLRDKLAQVIISLPAQAIVEPGLQKKIQSALARYAAAQIETAQLEIEHLRRRGRFSLISAIVIILVAIALVWFIGQLNLFGGTLQSFLVSGLSVFAWVAVWEPFNIYLYNWRIPARNRRIFELLRQAEVVIQAQSGQTEKAGND